HKKARNSDPIRTNATKLPSVKVKQPREQHTDAFVTRYLHNPQECLRVDFGRDPAEFPSSAGFRPFSSNTHFQVQLNFHPIWLKNCKKGNKMKGFSGLVASFLAVSTFPLLSFPSQFQEKSSFGEKSSIGKEQFTPRFDGLRFIETLITAHR
ncbi:uncharacterized protein LOC130801754, partial [Amaranthus tricolor]|uniref:uncharacterized protein LOC130801754 n=1 Tax=Amaranthus tricolor TaxID=29722 RepID=UPI00258D4385